MTDNWSFISIQSGPSSPLAWITNVVSFQIHHPLITTHKRYFSKIRKWLCHVPVENSAMVSHWSLQNDSSYLSPHDLVPLQFPVFFHLYSRWLCPEGPSSIPSSLTLRRIPLRDTLLTASVQIRWRFWELDSLCATAPHGLHVLPAPTCSWLPVHTAPAALGRSAHCALGLGIHRRDSGTTKLHPSGSQRHLQLLLNSIA